MSNFFKDLVEQIKDESTSIVADGEGAAEFAGFIDTGCYALNALLSGTIYGGVADNKITGFGGDPSTGKTFFVLSIVKHFLDSDPEAGVVYYDTEAAVTKEMMESRGVDTKRVILAEPQTIQQFRTHALKLIDKYEGMGKKRPRLMFVLDSLGMLSTTKELEDMVAGNETRDMTKAQVIRGAFRALTLKLAKIRAPMLVTNHVYEVIGSYVPTKAISGGGGFKFAASIIALLSKAKDRDGTDVVGNIITVKLDKSRLTKENKAIKVRLSYTSGLDRYYGLVDLAEKYDVFKKDGKRLQLPDGKLVFRSVIENDPEKYFTKEVLDQLDQAARREFCYGEDELPEPVSED